MIDERLRPQANLGIVILGHNRINTDAEGRFTFQGVAAPYDLAVGLRHEEGALVYVGLTRSDPTIVIPAPGLVGVSTAQVNGSARGLLQDPDRKAEVFFEAATATRSAAIPSDDFQMHIAWFGSSTVPGTLHVLEWGLNAATGLPTQYTAYGSTPASITAGAHVNVPDVHVSAPVGTGLIAGNVSLATGHQIVEKRLFVGFGAAQRDAWQLIHDTGTQTSFSYATPELANNSFTLQVATAGSTGWRNVFRTALRSSEPAITVAVPPAPELLGPDPFDRLTHITPFSWSPRQDALYMLSLRYAGTTWYYPPPQSLYVFTTRSSLILPDLRPYGIGFHPGAEYEWQVFDWTPFSHVDQIAVPTWLAIRGDRTMGTSAPRRVRMD